eukprot:scaffold9618_cov123-Isochrysis_galbana.AAC.2
MPCRRSRRKCARGWTGRAAQPHPSPPAGGHRNRPGERFLAPKKNWHQGVALVEAALARLGARKIASETHEGKI